MKIGFAIEEAISRVYKSVVGLDPPIRLFLTLPKLGVTLSFESSIGTLQAETDQVETANKLLVSSVIGRIRIFLFWHDPSLQ